jgi:hypothetical protein
VVRIFLHVLSSMIDPFVENTPLDFWHWGIGGSLIVQFLYYAVLQLPLLIENKKRVDVTCTKSVISVFHLDLPAQKQLTLTSVHNWLPCTPDS